MEALSERFIWLFMAELKDKKHWKDYEIQKADGHWTTVYDLVEELKSQWKQEALKDMPEEKMKINRAYRHGFQDGYALAMTDESRATKKLLENAGLDPKKFLSNNVKKQ